MRNNIVHQGVGELTYEIRGIVEVAEKIKSLGQEIYWENIGDPVAKGYQIPAWIKDIVKKAINENKSFAYNPTKGLLETREFLARKRNTGGGAKITADDICFLTAWATPFPKFTLTCGKNPALSARPPLIPLTPPPKRRIAARLISLTISCRKKLATRPERFGK